MKPEFQSLRQERLIESALESRNLSIVKTLVNAKEKNGARSVTSRLQKKTYKNRVHGGESAVTAFVSDLVFADSKWKEKMTQDSGIKKKNICATIWGQRAMSGALQGECSGKKTERQRDHGEGPCTEDDNSK